MFRNKRNIVIFALVGVFCVIAAFSAISQDKVEKYIPDAASAEQGMTLWQIIAAGGEVMVVLALLSVAALALIVYYFLTLKFEKLLPQSFLDSIISLIESKKYEQARILCSENENIISEVAMSGLEKVGRDKVIIEEAMLDTAKRGTTDLWQKLSYLSDVAVISPMVGLLGTVLGMIQAFNVIAFQTGAVKPILLAGGISKAMVTTATGLIIAIPAMIFYSFFRGRLQAIISQYEHISTELFRLVTDGTSAEAATGSGDKDGAEA